MSNVGQASLGIAGGIIGGVIGMVGGPAGIALGAFRGASIGLMIGGVLFPNNPKSEDSYSSVGSLSVTSSGYGSSIPIIYGTRKVPGNIIYYGNFTPIAHVTETESGGKGGGGESSTSTSYTYTVSLAIGICMNIGTTKILKAWQGDIEISSSVYTVYDGTQTTPDSHLQACLTTEGKTRFPVWKNLVYVVFPNFDLGSSTSLPNISFEVLSIPILKDIEYEASDWGDLISTVNLEADNSTAYPGEVENMVVYEDYIYVYRHYEPNTYAEATNLIHVYDKNGTYVKEILLQDTVYSFRAANHFAVSDGCIYLDCVVAGGNNHYIVSYDSVSGVYNDSMFLDASLYSIFNMWVYDNVLYDVEQYTADDGAWANIAVQFRTTTLVAGAGSVTSVTALPGMYARKAQYPDTFDVGESPLKINILRYHSTSALDPVAISTSTVGGDFTDLHTINVGLPTGFTDETVLGGGVSSAKVCGLDVVYSISLCTYGGLNSYRACKYHSTSGYSISQHALPCTQPMCMGIGDNYSKLYYLYNPGTGTKQISIVNTNDFCGYPAAPTVATDVYPSDVSKDILTNTLYGLGLTEATYLNTTNFAATKTDCTTNDMLVSMVFNGQQSILDVLQYIINHHNGYVTYYDGKISHNQLKKETALASYNDTYVIKDEGDSLPISLTKKGSRDCYNKVIIEYSKREKNYNVGTAIDDDSVDITNYGLQATTISLDSLTTFTRAQKMAGLLLKSYLFNPQQLSFKLGPKSLALKPGDVITYTDEDLELDNLPIRISSINEGKDYQIEIEAQEESEATAITGETVGELANSGVYTFQTYGVDSSTVTESPDLYSDASSVTNEVLVEIHPNYTELCALAISASKPDETQWAGNSLYKSYSSGGTFTRIDTASFSGVTGLITGLGVDSSGYNYIDVVFTYDYTFSSAISLDSLIVSPKTNLFIVQGSYGDIYFRFQDADLVSTLTWRFSNLIYNCTEFSKINEVGDIVIGDKFVLYNPTQFFLTLTNTDKHATLYFKLPSYNFKGTEQSLASVSEKSKLIAALIDVPLTPYNGKINSIGLDSSDSATINSGDIDLEFCSRNRKNLYFSTHNVDVPEDSDFVYFQIEVKKSDDTLLRTVTQTTKTYTYTTALQTTDGGPFSDYKFVIKQKNSSEWSSAYTINITLV